MKKQLFYLVVAIICNSQLKAQITLDTIIAPTIGRAYDFYLAQISKTETKYVFLDTLNNTFSLYNMDFTPFMVNITVPEPFWEPDHYLRQPLYITRTLFDCDSTNIEYAYYSSQNINNPFKVLRTDGTVLLQVDSANGPYCIGSCLGMTDVFVPIRNTSDGAKLFLQTGIQGYQQILIYSLCDELPVEVFDFAQLEQQPMVNVFPNPAMGLLSFQINLPDNMQNYDLVILNSDAREIKREKLNFGQSSFTLDVKNFSSGSYYYSLCTKSKAYQSGKFIVTQ